MKPNSRQVVGIACDSVVLRTSETRDFGIRRKFRKSPIFGAAEAWECNGEIHLISGPAFAQICVRRSRFRSMSALRVHCREVLASGWRPGGQHFLRSGRKQRATLADLLDEAAARCVIGSTSDGCESLVISRSPRSAVFHQCRALRDPSWGARAARPVSVGIHASRPVSQRCGPLARVFGRCSEKTTLRKPRAACLGQDLGVNSPGRSAGAWPRRVPKYAFGTSAPEARIWTPGAASANFR